MTKLTIHKAIHITFIMDDKMIWQLSLLLSEVIFTCDLSNGMHYHYTNEN